jgi:hypothetical protein
MLINVNQLMDLILPYGPSFLPKGKATSCSRQNIIRGKTKTNVLPLPVNAIPMISLPDNL